MNASVIDFFRAMKTGKFTFDLCDVSKAKGFMLEKTNLQGKDSSSPSRNAFTNIALSALGNKKLPIALKIFEDKKDDQDILGLKYEMKIYKRIIENIILKNQSPNFVAYIASACCRKDTGLYKKLAEDLKYNNYCVLATEKVGNGSYFGFEGEYPVNTLAKIYPELDGINRIYVMLQICYSLELVQRYRIVHNDFHAGNVLVMTLPEIVTMGFDVDGEKYKIRTRYIPYLFDWDLGYCELFGPNPKIEDEFYHKINIYNRFNKKIDFYMLLCTLKLQLPEFMNDLEDQKFFIRISRATVEEIRKFRPLFKDERENPVYKFGKAQLIHFFGDEYNKLMYGSFSITKDATGYMAEFYSGFRCRPSTIHEDMETPLQYLKRKSSYFKVKDFEGIPPKFTYSLPLEEKNTTIFIDSLMAKRGRQALYDLGVEPRFPPQKSGAVRTRNKVQKEDTYMFSEEEMKDNLEDLGKMV